MEKEQIALELLKIKYGNVDGMIRQDMLVKSYKDTLTALKSMDVNDEKKTNNKLLEWMAEQILCLNATLEYHNIAGYNPDLHKMDGHNEVIEYFKTKIKGERA